MVYTWNIGSGDDVWVYRYGYCKQTYMYGKGSFWMRKGAFYTKHNKHLS